MEKIYSYVVNHDFGLAPNPFGFACTLAVCKPCIRKSSKLNIGDWIIGTSGENLKFFLGRNYKNKLVYAMQVTEKLTFEEYWHDSRFSTKKPNVLGSLLTMYGDNIYCPVYDNRGNLEKFSQLNSAHSHDDGTSNSKHQIKDLKGKFVLISNNFYYFGNNAKIIPREFWFLKKCQTLEIDGEEYRGIPNYGVGHKIIKPLSIQHKFLQWLNTIPKGIQGTPCNWTEHKQLNIF